MADEATAEALASQDVPETDDMDAELDAAFDKAQEADDQPDEAQPEGDEEQAEAEEADAEAEADEDAEGDEGDDAEAVEAPSDMPASVRAQWANMTPEAREAVTASVRDMGRKMSDMGRQYGAMKPIQDSLIRASKELPAMLDMKPEQVADELTKLAKISQSFNSDPAGTLMGLIDQHGMREQVARALNTTAAPRQEAPQVRGLQEHIARLERQLQEVTDPQAFDQRFEQAMTVRQAQDVVTTFAQKQEHWPTVEDDVLAVLPRVQEKLGPSASHEDVLNAAYNMALTLNGLSAQAPQERAGTPAATVDPVKTERAKQAKSVNVASRSGTRTKPKTWDEELDAAFERAQRA